MLGICLFLMAVAVVLFCIEMFLPGIGVCGVVGFILLAVSSALAIAYVPFGLIWVLMEIAVLGMGGFFAFRYIRKRQWHGKIVLDESLREDTSEIGGLENLMGKEGVSKTPLKPFGFVEFNGFEVEAASNGPLIPANHRVKVVSVEKKKITVKQM